MEPPQEAGFQLTFALASTGAAPHVFSQQTDFLVQLRAAPDAASVSWLHFGLEVRQSLLQASQCILGVVLQPLQLVLNLPTQLAVAAQQLHLRHDAVEVLAVVAGQSFDLTDVVTQVQNLPVVQSVRDNGQRRCVGVRLAGLTWSCRESPDTERSRSRVLKWRI